MRTAITPALLALLALTACETVTSVRPLGETPTVLEADEWAGIWHDEDDELRLEVMDARQGKVRIFFEEDGEPQDMTLWLRDSGGWTFFNVLQADVDEENRALPGSDRRFFWGRVLRDGDRLLVWGPEPARFVELVDEGVLPGSVDQGSVVLEALGPGHHRIITTGSHGVLMEWEAPLALFRKRAASTVPATE